MWWTLGVACSLFFAFFEAVVALLGDMDEEVGIVLLERSP
jgi:hypothetical protein